MSREAANWIIVTGQAWKLYVALAGFIGSLVFMTLALFSLGMGGGRFMALVVAGIFLACTTFTWFSMVLRCPHCTARLVWTMVASRPHSSWMIDLAALDRCPVCDELLDQAGRGCP